NELLFTADRFAQMKHSAIFYNVGRGDTVDQYALWTVLETKRIAGAFLDVTTPEPLLADSPLWSAPNCFITPHIAGGRQNEMESLVRHFVMNYERYLRGEALQDRIV